MAQASIRAIGMAVPEKVVDNQYFESFLDTTDEWIVSRTGIQTRRHCGPNEYTSNLCVRAVRDLMRHYDLDLSEVDMIIVSTVTPDQPMPSMACIVQYRMEIPNTGAIDLYAACAGFSYGLVVAKGLIAAGTHRKIIVIGADALSKVTDFADRTSCVLFGDGAGAVLVEAAETGNIGQCITGAFGEGGIDLYISGMAPAIDGQPIVCNGKIVQNGRKVFKWAVTTVGREVPRLLALNGLQLADIDWFVPHSANMRIIEAICKETNIPMEKVLQSIVKYGNTSSASIPLAWYEGVRDGRVKSGDRLLLFGFGGGLAYAATVVTWP